MNIEKGSSNKTYTTAVILSGIFGPIGIHHLYLGRWKMFLLDFGLFVGTLIFYFNNYLLYAGLIFMVDIIHTIIVTYLLMVGKYRYGKGKIIPLPGQTIN